MALGGEAAGLQFRLAGAVVEHEILDEAARLDVGQDALHFLLRFFGDDARAGLDVAIFGGVRDRIAHVGDAESGRASCRERVCQCVWISVVAVSLKKKKKYKNTKKKK